jgi:hypothetical protein
VLKVINIYKAIWVVIIIFISSNLNACDCLWGGDFFSLSQKSDFILEIEVVGYEKIEQDFNEILVVQIKKIYKGNFQKDTIRFRGDNGMSCSPYVSYFKKGKRYILQFDSSDHNIPFLSNCGGYFLSLEGNTVYPEKGVQKDLSQIGVMSLSEFESQLALAIRGQLGVPLIRLNLKESKKANHKIEKKGTIYFWTILIISIVLIIVLILFVFRKWN